LGSGDKNFGCALLFEGVGVAPFGFYGIFSADVIAGFSKSVEVTAYKVFAAYYYAVYKREEQCPLCPASGKPTSPTTPSAPTSTNSQNINNALL